MRGSRSPAARILSRLWKRSLKRGAPSAALKPAPRIQTVADFLSFDLVSGGGRGYSSGCMLPSRWLGRFKGTRARVSQVHGGRSCEGAGGDKRDRTRSNSVRRGGRDKAGDTVLGHRGAGPQGVAQTAETPPQKITSNPMTEGYSRALSARPWDPAGGHVPSTYYRSSSPYAGCASVLRPRRRKRGVQLGATRRIQLKIRRPQGLTSSSLVSGTAKVEAHQRRHPRVAISSAA